MTTLTFVRWCTAYAVYRDGELVHWGGSGDWSLLGALGYRCRELPEIPTHGIPLEYDRDAQGRWVPPRLPADLEAQQAAVAARKKRERVEELRRELARLEGT